MCSTPKSRDKGQVVGLIMLWLESPDSAVYWSNVDISNGLLTNQQNIAKNAIFVSGIILALNQGPVTPQNVLHLLKLDELSFHTSQEMQLDLQ